MKKLCLLILVAVAVLSPALSKKAGHEPFAGRCDLTVKMPKDTYPSWMEFTDNGGKPDVRIVGRVASAHPAKDLKLEGSHLSFTTSEW